MWPWLVQMGWSRAGWYTYRWVDRLHLDSWWLERAFLATIVPADFVMARGHLRGLRARAMRA